MSNSSFYIKESCLEALPQKITNLISDSFFSGDLLKLNLTTREINNIFQYIDYKKAMVIKDIDMSGIYLPDNSDLSDSLFENVKNISSNISGASLKYAQFTNCAFKGVHFRRISSFESCEFDNCSFEDCRIVLDDNSLNLNNIIFKGKNPGSLELIIETCDFKSPLPDWRFKNLQVQIALEDDDLFSKEEKRLLNIHYNDCDDLLIECSPEHISKDILDKIFKVIDDSSVCPIFDGVDFSDYSIPEFDVYGASFVGCNLQNTKFIGNPNLSDNTDFRHSQINGVSFGNYPPSSLDYWKSNNLITTEFVKKGTERNKGMNNAMTFSADQLKSIQDYTAAAPAVANLCRKAVKRLLRFLLTKAGKAKSMITSYVNVAMDLLETFKEEANLLFQLIIGYVCANLHKVGEYMNIDEKSFLKFFSSKKVQAFGEFCVANGKGSAIASLLKRATDIGEAFAGQLFANPEFQRIASVIENPETAARISEPTEDDSESEAEEVTPVKKTRKHS